MEGKYTRRKRVRDLLYYRSIVQYVEVKRATEGEFKTVGWMVLFVKCRWRCTFNRLRVSFYPTGHPFRRLRLFIFSSFLKNHFGSEIRVFEMRCNTSESRVHSAFPLITTIRTTCPLHYSPHQSFRPLPSLTHSHIYCPPQTGSLRMPGLPLRQFVFQARGNEGMRNEEAQRRAGQNITEQSALASMTFIMTVLV